MSYATQIRVVRFIIHETGTYNEQFRRPYVSQLTPQGLNNILENVVTAPDINAGVFSGLANQVLAPSPTYESQITIPYGWTERRFRFMLHLEVTYKTGGVIQEIITGWSETPASSVSLYGKLDPKTVFKVNNTIHIRQQNINTPFGVQTQSSISDCSHVLSDSNWSGIYTPNRQIAMRPSDIFSKLIVSGVEDELAASNSYDGTSTLTSIATKSKRTNTVATNYIGDIVRSYTQAESQLGITNDPVGNMDALSTAQSYSRENSAARDPFLETISNLTGNPITDYFTLEDLQRLDPNALNNTTYIKMSTTEMASTHQAGQTQHWGGSDLHTHVATILSNAVPSIMVNQLITRIAFVTTNMDFSGRIDTRIADLDGFVSNMDMSGLANGFIGKLENEILKDFAMSEIGFGIQMQVDLLGETWIKVNINGEEFDYVTPSFCDAMLVPIVTTNNQTAKALAHDLGTLMTTIADHKGNHNLSGIQTDVKFGYNSLL